jgi:hypothetical protein
VKQFKELNANIAALREVQAGSSIRPEQKQDVEAAIEQLRRLRRKPDATMPEIYRCVRRITEKLVSAFFLE